MNLESYCTASWKTLGSWFFGCKTLKSSPATCGALIGACKGNDYQIWTKKFPLGRHTCYTIYQYNKRRAILQHKDLKFLPHRIKLPQSSQLPSTSLKTQTPKNNSTSNHAFSPPKQRNFPYPPSQRGKRAGATEPPHRHHDDYYCGWVVGYGGLAVLETAGSYLNVGMVSHFRSWLINWLIDGSFLRLCLYGEVLRFILGTYFSSLLTSLLLFHHLLVVSLIIP